MVLGPQQCWIAIGTGTNNARGKREQQLRLWDLQTGEAISPPMPHGDRVYRVTLSGDGAYLATGSRDSHIRVFEVPEEARTGNELRKLTSILAGVELDALDNLNTVSSESTAESWNTLRHIHPGDFAASTYESNAWYRRQIDLELRAGNIVEASQLLNDLVAIDPQDPELYRRRITLQKKLRRFESIPQDAELLQHVMRHSGFDLAEFALLISDEADGADELNRYAITLADRAVTAAPNDPNTWRYRALMHIRVGNLESAIADLEKVTEMQPGNFRPWYELALLKLKLEDRAGYEKTCRAMINAIPPSRSTLIEQFVTWTAALAAVPIDDWVAANRKGRLRC